MAEFDDALELASIVSLDEGINDGDKVALVKLGLTKLTPNLRLVCLLSKLCSRADVVELVQDDLNGINWLIELLVDAKGFLVEGMLIFKGHFGKLVTIIVVQTIDVVHDSGCVSPDSCQNQQVLQTLILSEI